MKFYNDIVATRPLIEESIKRFGYAPEHNVDHYIYTNADYKQGVFVHFPDGAGLLARRDVTDWDILSEPVAASGRRVEVLLEFISEALKDASLKKVTVELYTETRRALLAVIPKTLRARRVAFTLQWPVFDLAKFDPLLPGGRYKDLRNARNAFYRDHRVEVRDVREVPKSALVSIVEAWKKNRQARDKAYTKLYRAYIDNAFRGTTHARALVVDGHVAGINAGWKIPNTNTYYAAIGLHDYSFRDLGDMLNLEDLAFLKAAGYTHADFAGGEKALTRYKLKFGEAEIYKSFVFSVVRK